MGRSHICVVAYNTSTSTAQVLAVDQLLSRDGNEPEYRDLRPSDLQVYLGYFHVCTLHRVHFLLDGHGEK